MSALQKSASASLVAALAGCLLLVALSVQEGAAAPINSHCRLKESNFFGPHIFNLTFTLAKEAILEDNNTDVRLIENDLLHGVPKSEQCYLMKQVLNFTLEEVLLPRIHSFQPYMQQVVPFLDTVSRNLSLCHIHGNDQHIQRKVNALEDTVRELGESGAIKAIGELGLLFLKLKEACV
ncbi:interleukin-22 [Echinops telfairi]|uniref:Interleukin-22 n=1 Tax=Echinops telfairi TaxID=9371 RepID=A0ABM0II36_ECHTE|nr:interleukin-22 [Echinops telfairi]